MKKQLQLLATGLFVFSVCVIGRAEEPQAQATSESAPVIRLQVPFIPQEQAANGASALAMLLAGSNDVEAVRTTLVTDWPKDKMDARIRLANKVRQQGWIPYPVADQAAILAALTQGYPILVAERVGKKTPLVFSVLTGADPTQKLFFLHTGQQENQLQSFHVFEQRWLKADRWAMLALNPAQLPDTLEPAVVVKELFGLAQQGQRQAAQQGLTRAVLNWPSYKAAWVGLASVAEQNGELALAESSLRELVRRQPNYGPGLNNLADLLYRSQREEEALVYAERAVAVLDMPQTRGLLAAIHHALQAKKVSASAQ